MSPFMWEIGDRKNNKYDFRRTTAHHAACHSSFSKTIINGLEFLSLNIENLNVGTIDASVDWFQRFIFYFLYFFLLKVGTIDASS